MVKFFVIKPKSLYTFKLNPNGLYLFYLSRTQGLKRMINTAEQKINRYTHVLRCTYVYKASTKKMLIFTQKILAIFIKTLLIQYFHFLFIHISSNLYKNIHSFNNSWQVPISTTFFENPQTFLLLPVSSFDASFLHPLQNVCIHHGPFFYYLPISFLPFFHLFILFYTIFITLLFLLLLCLFFHCWWDFSSVFSSFRLPHCLSLCLSVLSFIFLFC